MGAKPFWRFFYFDAVSGFSWSWSTVKIKDNLQFGHHDNRVLRYSHSSLSLSLSLTHIIELERTHVHTYTHKHMHSHLLTLTCANTLVHIRTHSSKHTRTYVCTYFHAYLLSTFCLVNKHKHTCYPHTHFYTLTHPHTLTHTRTHSHTLAQLFRLFLYIFPVFGPWVTHLLFWTCSE